MLPRQQVEARGVFYAVPMPSVNNPCRGLGTPSGSVLKAPWPETGEVDGWMSRSFQFLKKNLANFRVAAGKVRCLRESTRMYSSVVDGG